MQIKLLKQVSNLKPGQIISVKPNGVNYYVGVNGSGKTITFSALAHAVPKEKVIKGNWMTKPPGCFDGAFQFDDFGAIKHVYHFTAKTRQSQWVDLGMAFESAAGVGALHSSEGMNNQAELVRLFTEAQKDPKKDKATLYIFDEIDGPLDLRAKAIFFDHLLTKLKGTIIVCSHDCFFLAGKDVFDFSDGTMKTAMKYLNECRAFGTTSVDKPAKAAKVKP